MEASVGSIVAFSLGVALISTAIVIPFGLAAAWLLARRSFFGKGVVETVFSLPLVLPPTAVGLALLALVEPVGPLGGALERMGIEVVFTAKAVVLATTVMSFPLFVRSARSALESVDVRLFPLARSLGKTPAQAFAEVTLPLAWRGIAGGALLAFSRALGEFGATILVAGNIPGRTQTLALAIFHDVQRGADSRAWELAGITCLIAFAAVWLTERLTRAAP